MGGWGSALPLRRSRCASPPTPLSGDAPQRPWAARHVVFQLICCALLEPRGGGGRDRDRAGPMDSAGAGVPGNRGGRHVTEIDRPDPRRRPLRPAAAAPTSRRRATAPRTARCPCCCRTTASSSTPSATATGARCWIICASCGLIDAANAPISVSRATVRGEPRRRRGARRRAPRCGAAALGGRPADRPARPRSGIAGCAASSATCRARGRCATTARRRSSAYRRGRATPALPCWPAIRTADGRFTAVEVTYLAPNGRRADGPAAVAQDRRAGARPAARSRLDPAAEEMLVAEGVFTTLSASEWFGLPGWALMSTRNLRVWSPPAGVRSVLIAADRGKDGEASAELLRGSAGRRRRRRDRSPCRRSRGATGTSGPAGSEAGGGLGGERKGGVGCAQGQDDPRPGAGA